MGRGDGTAVAVSVPATGAGSATAPHVRRERLIGLALVVVSACGYGSGGLFAKPVYASGVDWLTLMTWRFLLAAVLSWLWLAAWPANRRALKTLSRRRVGILVALGVFFVGNTATYYAALESVDVSLTALIVYLYPALVAVLSIRWGRRLEGRRPWLALVIATAGVTLAVGGIDATVMPPLLGLALAVLSPIWYAVYIVLSARLAGERPTAPAGRERGDSQTAVPHESESVPPSEETDPAPASAVMMTATFVAYVAIVAAAGRPVLDPGAIPAEAWLGVLGIGIVSTAIAVQTFYAGARRLGAAQASLVSTVEPVYTIALATLLLGEVLSPIQLVGGVLVIAGVILAQTARPVRDAGDPREVRAAAA
jgi:drug/metabolite transporter (DMT)-like permease